MNPIVYDASRLVGLVLAAVGAGISWGIGPGLFVAGVGLAVLTETGARR